MNEWLPIGLASLAIVISIITSLWNRRHSESILRRTSYPAVAWHIPTVSRLGESTTLSVTVCNHGPVEIGDVWFDASLSSGLRTAAWWCLTSRVKSVPTKEELQITITESLEQDIDEWFSSLYIDENWHFKGRPRSYKAVLRFEYQPLLAETSPVTRKSCYKLRPVVEDGAITSWQIVPVYWPRSVFPIF